MKNTYTTPRAEELTLNTEQILTTSPEGNDNEGNLGDLLGGLVIGGGGNA